jgi:hypothetical protein
MSGRLFVCGCVLITFFAAQIHRAESQELNDLLITEVMSDPSPSAGLPVVEYLELYNRSGLPISIKNWKLWIGSRSVLLPDSLLPPHSYTLLCHKNSTQVLSGFGGVIGLSSFGLTNEGASLALYNHQNRLIHSVNYMDTWWPPEKRSGGYALEMVDVESPCLGRKNWEVSTDPSGGSPGRQNSTVGHRPDSAPPIVIGIEIPSARTLMLIFDKRLDSLSAVNGAGISVSGRSIVEKRVIGPSFQQLVLTLGLPLLAGQRYEIHLQNITDCAGNLLRNATMYVALPVQADSGDVVINEILFNPGENGVDFVEIYNRSIKYISLKGWGLGNLKDGKVDVVKLVTAGDLILPPNGFLALTTDADRLEAAYPSDQAGRLLEMPSMPSFPNENGGVVLLDQLGRIFDRFAYSKTMHQPLLSEMKGVSLERVDSGKPAWETGNWHSGASTVGYATPGYANSQLLLPKAEDEFVITPEAFTPDQDGVDDFVAITYNQRLTGSIASVRIFDVNGRLIKNVLRNQLIGTSGKITWNGSDENNEVVMTGYYLILIDTFDISGNKAQFKKKVVVVSR